MTLFLRIAPWVAGSALVLQGCAHQPPTYHYGGHGIKTYPYPAAAAPEVTTRRPLKDGPPLVKLNPDEVQDAVPRTEGLARYGNHTPYDVLGKRYYLLETAKNYTDSGIASWYGEKFHGQPTSTMEPYDLYAMTAAHKTLPLPTYVKVTNLENNRSAIVRVNDRGPFVDDRVIDMSYAAAVKLGYADKGTARVRVEAINFADTPMITRGETRPLKKTAATKVVATNSQASAAKSSTGVKTQTGSKPKTAMLLPTGPAKASTGLLIAAGEPTSAGRAALNNGKVTGPMSTASTVLDPSAKSKPRKPLAATTANTTPSAKETDTNNAAPVQLAMADKQIFLQAGSFSDHRAATSLQSQLTQLVKAPVKIAKNDNSHFRVHVGPFTDENTAKEALAQIRQSQLAEPLLIRR